MATNNKTAPAAAKPVPAAKAKITTDADKVKADSKSVVPAKYAGKYKNGGSGPTSEFIAEQCTGKDGFEFPAFFTLARKNGIPEDQVAKYEQGVNDKVNGAAGRARMTLGNTLRAMARKNQKLKGINGKDADVAEPALPKKEKAAA